MLKNVPEINRQIMLKNMSGNEPTMMLKMVQKCTNNRMLKNESRNKPQKWFKSGSINEPDICWKLCPEMNQQYVKKDSKWTKNMLKKGPYMNKEYVKQCVGDEPTVC